MRVDGSTRILCVPAPTSRFSGPALIVQTAGTPRPHLHPARSRPVGNTIPIGADTATGMPLFSACTPHGFRTIQGDNLCNTLWTGRTTPSGWNKLISSCIALYRSKITLPAKRDNNLTHPYSRYKETTPHAPSGPVTPFRSSRMLGRPWHYSPSHRDAFVPSPAPGRKQGPK